MRRLWDDRRGQDLVEYALVVAAAGFLLLATVEEYSVRAAGVLHSLEQLLTGVGFPR